MGLIGEIIATALFERRRSLRRKERKLKKEKESGKKDNNQ